MSSTTVKITLKEETIERRSSDVPIEKNAETLSHNIHNMIQAAEVDQKDESAIQSSIETKSYRPIWKFWKKDDSLDMDPYQFSPLKKALILITVAFATTAAPISSTIYFPAIIEIQNSFNTTATIINTSISVFIFADAIFPLIWAPFSDVFGRRKIYLISFLINIVGCIGCALSVNVGMFIGFRTVSAMGSSSVISMGAGTIADVFDSHERGRAMSLYACGPLLGPAIAPIIGGYMNQNLGWHSIFYFIAAYGAAVWLFILFFLPETWRPRKGLPGSEPEKPLSVWRKVKQVNPLRALRFLLFGNIALCAAFSGVCILIFYLLNTTFSRTYASVYGYSSGTVGLCFLPLAFGGIVGSTIGGRLADRFYNRSCEKAGGIRIPEMRINLIVLGCSASLLTVSMIVYGWCVQKKVHEAAGLICIFFIAIGLLIPSVTIQAYIVDCFRSYGASVTACNNFVRFALGGIGALVATDLQVALGDGVLYTIFGGISAFMFLTMVFLKYKQAKWESDREQFTNN